MKYKCLNCGYVYDEEKEELDFKKLSNDWTCPECGSLKLDFEIIEEETDLNIWGDEAEDEGDEGSEEDDEDFEEYYEEDY